jgi:hypothetical protein
VAGKTLVGRTNRPASVISHTSARRERLTR